MRSARRQKTTKASGHWVLGLVVCVLFNATSLAEVIAHNSHGHGSVNHESGSHESGKHESAKHRSHKPVSDAGSMVASAAPEKHSTANEGFANKGSETHSVEKPSAEKPSAETRSHDASHAHHSSVSSSAEQPSDLFENSLQGIVAFEAQAGSQPDSQAVLQLESESKAQQSDEFICDDVCCLSSASLSQLRAGLAAPQLASVSAQADAGYLSITLDLVLPPPNIS